MKVEKGDLVRIRGWKIKVGIVEATETAWYMIKNHVSVASQIVDLKDVKEILIKQAVPKKYQRYL